jgi:hypothetical protein
MIIFHQQQGAPGGLILETLDVDVTGSTVTVKGAVSVGEARFEIDVAHDFNPAAPGGLYIHADGTLSPELGPLVLDRVVWWDAEGVHAKTPADPGSIKPDEVSTAPAHVEDPAPQEAPGPAGEG